MEKEKNIVDGEIEGEDEKTMEQRQENKKRTKIQLLKLKVIESYFTQ